MAERLTGKVALVTGGARGTGAAIAARFVEEGAEVVVADILDERGEALVAGIGRGARYVHCDVAREEDWHAALALLDGVDVLVNNAAILHLSAIADTSVDTVQRVFEVNELGTFLGIRSVIPTMRERGGGSIINISSIDGVFVTPGTAAYAASKFAVPGSRRPPRSSSDASASASTRSALLPATPRWWSARSHLTSTTTRFRPGAAPTGTAPRSRVAARCATWRTRRCSSLPTSPASSPAPTSWSTAA